MGSSRRKLFVSATVSGLTLRLGLPGLAELISLIWDIAREPLASLTPSGLTIIISLVSLAVFAVVTYLTWEIYLRGAKKGKKGLLVVLAGVLTGFILGSFLLAMAEDTLASL